MLVEDLKSFEQQNITFQFLKAESWIFFGFHLQIKQQQIKTLVELFKIDINLLYLF